MKRIWLVVLLLSFVGCLSTSTPLTGIWRSTLAQLTLTEQGGSIIFTCATGSISQPVKPDSGGQFSVPGTYTQLSGVQPPVPPTPQSITYSGKVEGSAIILDGNLQSGAKIGPIKVIKDSPQQVLICPQILNG